MVQRVSAIGFRQWLSEWDGYEYDEEQFRRRPDGWIYLFSMPAVQLRALSGVFKREHTHLQASGVQRGHEESRSSTIRQFVRFGYPYGKLSGGQRNRETNKLKKPGWLPTAIVVNILTVSDERRGVSVHDDDIVNVVPHDDGRFEILIPDVTLGEWVPKQLPPMEIIDGQHRLWAFDEHSDNGHLEGEFELPVVAFMGLDVGWQAYLFWSINVSPKRINPSHAFDLYPLLRSQEWLEKYADLTVYREARAQEITDVMFRHPESPWFERINMLGVSGKGGVTQAGWIRSLISSLLGPGGRGRAAKGLFGTEISPSIGPLPWSRAQQAAFLIDFWGRLKAAVVDGKHDWASKLFGFQFDDLSREQSLLAFEGRQTILNQEQGVRGVLSVLNDLYFQRVT